MGEGSRSPHFLPGNHLAQRAGPVRGGGSRSPHFYPCHHLAERAGPVHGGRE